MYCTPLRSMRACRREAVFSPTTISQVESRPSESAVFSRGNSMVRSPISRVSLTSTLALEASPANWVASSVSPHISSNTRTASCLPLTWIASRSRRPARCAAGALVEAGVDRFRGGRGAELLVEGRAAARVGRKNRAFLGDQGHRNGLSYQLAHSNAWACCILVKYPLFSRGPPTPSLGDFHD